MAPNSDTGIASEIIRVERQLFKNKSTIKAASTVPSIRCSISESTMAWMNSASLEATLMVMPGGSCGTISVSSLCLTWSAISTVLVLAILTMPRPTVAVPLKRASWR